jgi:phosphoribosylanthranilate isomerase
MSVRVKICGITSLDDARAALNAGADALGLMFYEPSPRNLSLKEAARIAAALPPFIARVGVFVDAPEQFVRDAISACGLDAVQFHGKESPDYCARFQTKVIKAFRMRDASTLAVLPKYVTHAWLLDSFVSGQQGGTGAVFNWDLAVQAQTLGKPIVLAGGLTPENVTEAIAKVRPCAVDVSSGVESAPGKKDARRIRAFVAAAKGQH